MSTETKKDDLYAEMQKRLVASLVFNGEETGRVLEILEPDDIENEVLNPIFTQIAEISRRNEQVSPVTIVEALKMSGGLSKVGGPKKVYELFTLGEKYLREAPAIIYSRLVKNLSANNKASKIIKEYAPRFSPSAEGSSTETISDLQASLNSVLLSLSDDSNSVELSTSVNDYLDLLKERREISIANAEKADGLQGIPCLLPTINKLTTGWLPGQLITIGARTGVGKSIFAVNATLGALQANKSVLFFTLEMSADEIKDRLISSMSGIPLYKLKQGLLDDDDYSLLNKYADELRSSKLLIEAEPKATIDSIRAKSLRRAQSEAGLDMIVLDYLQLVTPSGKFNSRQEEVASMSRNMKLLAKQLNVPIMVLVQVNRESKDDEDSMPKLDQIRESGAIAQDSDIVILLHREKSLDDTINDTYVVLAKNRGGQADKLVRCSSNLACSLFRERPSSKDVNPSDEDIESLGDTGGTGTFENDLDLDDDFDLDFSDVDDLETDPPFDL